MFVLFKSQRVREGERETLGMIHKLTRIIELNCQKKSTVVITARLCIIIIVEYFFHRLNSIAVNGADCNECPWQIQKKKRIECNLRKITDKWVSIRSFFFI